MRKVLRAAGAFSLTTGLLLAGSTSASAHVSVIPSTTTAGAYALLTFGVPHGCEGSSTTRVSIQIPEQIAAVTPTVNPGWAVEKVMADLAEPVDDGYGGQRTQRVAEVVYTASTPLPDGYRDAFVLSLKLPDVAGDTLVFPAIQECQEGENAWVQVPQEGQDPHDLDLPAPSFTVTADAAGPHGDGSDADATTGAGQVAANASSDGVAAAQGGAAATAARSAVTPAATWVALVLGAGGLALGALAFLRTRRAQG